MVPVNDNQPRGCPVCGGAVVGKPTKIYCSAKCKRRKRDAKYDRHASAPDRECEHCGSTFRRRPSSRDARRFCSRQCGFAAKANVWQFSPSDADREIIALLSVSDTVAKRICGRCGARYDASRMTGLSLCSETCRDAHLREKYIAANDNGRDRSPRPCGECGEVFAPAYGDARRVFCSKECNRKAAVAKAKTSGAKAANRAVRKMRERAAFVERVNPIEVFTRDGWKCQLCGAKTPSALRGTYEPRAPELDHIMPISAGGEHSYRNVQCACRECNGRKGATPMGQMLLFG